MKLKVAFSFLVILTAVTAFETCGKKGGATRIVNGVPAGHGEFPWQISLLYGEYDFYWKSHICGGTLIGKRWVLSAAHCFYQTKDPSKYRVRVGEWFRYNDDEDEKDIKISKIIVHSEYNKPHPMEHDIALLELAEDADFSGPFIGAACMPGQGDDYRGAEGCWLSGWGLIAPPKYSPNQLQKLEGSIWTTEDLISIWGSRLIQPGMIGFGTKRESACMGDSGGPLVCPSKSQPGQFDVVGIVSWGTPKCQNRPGIFTEVAHFLPWINEHIK